MRSPIFAILFFSLLIIGCEENFSPKAGFGEQYILYAIFNGDTTYQSVYLSRSFDVPGFDPLSNTDDPFIADAEIEIIYRGTTITLKDTSSDREEGSRYSTPIPFYYTDNFQPGAKEVIEVKATLKNGYRLVGKTITPVSNYVQFLVGSDRTVPTDDGYIDIEWRLPDAGDAGQIYLPQLKIRYLRADTGTDIIYEKEVPINYIVSGGEYIPNYPQPTAETVLRYEMNAFDRSMEEISAGDPNKYDYTIIDATFELLLMDENLIPYYYATETFLDGFTIILDELEYSNIEGGLGVVGSFFLEKNYNIYISHAYIYGFGYRHN